jgi:uncharacterized protein YjiS (DUF1127 family)
MKTHSATLTTLHPGPAQGALLATMRRAVATVVTWHKRTRERAQLAALDAHLLRDIGISRDAAQWECNKPFWQA